MRTMISIDKKDLERLKKLAESERRKVSQQIVFMMDEYIKNRKGN